MITTIADRAGLASPLGYLLDALGVENEYNFVAPEGLSSVVVHVPSRDAILAQTLAAAPIFRAGVEASANRFAADVVLLRVGEVLDGSGPVTADVALAAPPCSAWVEHELTMWTDGDAVWFVPVTFGPSIEVTPAGFTVALIAPYRTQSEREVGIARASRDIGRRLQPVAA